MAIATKVPVYDIDVYKGVPYSLQFSVKLLDTGGNVTGSLDLTGKIISVIIDALFRDPLALLSANGITGDQSGVAILGDPADGNFKMTLSGPTLDGVIAKNGTWRVLVNDGQPDEILLTHGAVSVTTFTVDGSL